MDNNKLLTIAIILALSGIILLFFLSKIIEIKPTDIKKIDETYIGKTVKIEGVVSKVNSVGNITLFYVDKSELPLVIYSKIDIEKKNISAIGKVEEYKDDLQIIIDKLEYK